MNKDGWHRVTFAGLRKAGFAVPTRKASLRLYLNGLQVPMQVKRNGVEFYGRALDLPSTDTNVYWLAAGQNTPARILRVRAGSRAGAPSGSFSFGVDVKGRSNYLAVIPNGPEPNWFGKTIAPGSPADYTVKATHVEAGGKGTLKVSVLGYSAKPHAVKVSFNGNEVGKMTFDGEKGASTTLTLPANALKEGDNKVTFAATGGELDFNFFHALTLTYAHKYMADDNVLSFSVRPGQPVTVGGFSSRGIRVVDITKAEQPRELLGTVGGTEGNYTITVKPPAGVTQLYAFADPTKVQVPPVARNERSALYSASRSADLLIVSHRSFIPALKPLVELRQGQSLKTVVADVQDVFDEFSFGAHSPEALTTFFNWTRENWQRAPRYVLLVGDATYDPRNFSGTGNFDLVPTTFVDTAYSEAPSDDTLADFDGDGVPELAVGRLPVRTAAQTRGVVAKIVRYERSSNASRDVLLVSDKTADYDFDAESRTLHGMIPDSVTVNTLSRNEGPTDAAVRARLLAALNQGPTIVNYFGHGAAQIWTGASILKSSDATTLTNRDSLSLYLMMTCLNGYFVGPLTAGLGESLVMAPDGGAIATWSSTGLTVPTDQVRADQEAVKLLLSDPTMMLGDAMLRGKQVIKDVDVLRTWVLLGDPTTKLH